MCVYVCIYPCLSEITSNNQKECLPLIQKIYDTIGQPRNYGPSPQEEQEEQREDDGEERARREALEKAEEERRAARWQDWVRTNAVHSGDGGCSTQRLTAANACTRRSVCRRP